MRGRLGTATARLRSNLAETLFPGAAASPWPLGRWESALIAVAFLVLATIAQLLRVGPAEALEAVWAEDGPVFLQGAITPGFPDIITQTYAGYLVLVPRLIGEVGNLVPLTSAAPAIALSACFAVALAGLAVWHGAAGHIRNPYLRGLLVALTVLSPVASLEAVSSASYVSWYMTFACFWLLLWRPATTWGASLGGLFLLATGLTTPGIVFFAPLAALRVLAARGRRDLILLGSYAAGMAAQLPVTALSEEGTVDPSWTGDLWVSYMQRVLDGALLGEELGGGAWSSWGWAFLAPLVALVVGALLYGIWRANPPARWVAAIAAATSLAMYLVAGYQRAYGSVLIWPADFDFGYGGRYAIVPALLLIGAVLVLLDDRLRARPAAAWPRWLAGGVAAVLLLGLVSSFDLREPAVRGIPSWEEGLRAAAVTCEAEGAPAAAVGTAPPGFGVTISCERLEDLYGAPER